MDTGYDRTLKLLITPLISEGQVTETLESIMQGKELPGCPLILIFNFLIGEALLSCRCSSAQRFLP